VADEELPRGTRTNSPEDVASLPVDDASIFASGAAHSDLAWLAEALWGGLEGVTVSAGWFPPAGSTTVERYLVVPSRRRPRLLLPDETPAGREALWANRGIRAPRARWARSAMGLAYHPGLWDFVTRGLHRVGVHASDPDVPLLSRVLANILGEERVVLVVNVRPPSPFRKPVAQVLRPDGRLLAYVKVAPNDVTKRGVAREARALRALAERDDGRLLVPTLLHHGSWETREILVTEPLPRDVRRYPAGEGPPSIDVTREVAGLSARTRSALGTSRYWQELRRRAAAHSSDAARMSFDALLLAFLDAAEDRSGAIDTIFGTWHGDWSPWNLGFAGGRVVAWDWEYSTDGVPLGFDVLHFHFQSAFIGEGRPVSEAFARARAGARAPLVALGVEPDPTADAHVAEITLRYLEAMALGAEPNTRFLSGIGDVLLERARGSEG
jgi:hypothetical protein